MNFETNTIDLSLINVKTGNPLTANVYNVTFDDGSGRVMSMGQLVMAICLERATAMESDVIEIMEEMAGTTLNIETLSDIESKLVEAAKTSSTVPLQKITGDWTISVVDPRTGKTVTETATNAQQVCTKLGIDQSSAVETQIEYLESKLDQLNTNSQEQMILLQSQTNKRDQSYEMISNVLKSLYTVLSGEANNL